MLANSLVELDRAHLIHPVASWRGHEAEGVRLLTSAKGATRDRCRGAHACRRLRRPLVRQRRLWPGERRCRRRAPASRAALCDGVLRPRRGAGDPPCRPARRARAGRPRPCLFHARRLGRGGQLGSLRPLLLERPRQAAEGPVHLARAGLSRLLDGGRGPDRPAGLPRRLRPALRLAAQDPVALRLSQPGRVRSAGDHHGLDRCAPRQGRGARRAGARRRLLRRADPGLGRCAGAACRAG